MAKIVDIGTSYCPVKSLYLYAPVTSRQHRALSLITMTCFRQFISHGDKLVLKECF